MRERSLGSVLGLLIGLVGLGLACPVTAASDIDALWVAESDGAVQISAADGSLLVEVTEVSDVRAVAVDIRRSRIWLLAHGALLALDLEGEPVLETSVAAPNSVHSELAVHPVDGTVWVAVNRELWHFDAQGQLLHSFEMPGNVQALAVDAVASQLWVATQNTVSALDGVSGEEIRALELHPSDRVRDLAMDDRRSKLWLALRDRLRVYDIAGETLLLELPFQNLEKVAIDGRGGAWLAAKKDLYRLDASGAALVSVEPLGGVGTLGELAVGLDRTVWVANQTDIAHLEESGEIREMLIPSAGAIAAGDGPLFFADLAASGLILYGVYKGVQAVISESQGDDPYDDDDTEESIEEEERNLDKLRDPPNPKDVERRRKRHKEQIDPETELEELLIKKEEILKEWPDQPVGKTDQRYDYRLRRCKER